MRTTLALACSLLCACSFDRAALDASCASDDDCGPGRVCIERRCEEASFEISDADADELAPAHCDPACADGSLCCLAGTQPRCIDPRSNVEHCGVCGKACGANQVCLAGECACGPGWMDCDEDPVTLDCGTAIATDGANCGACGNGCEALEGCVFGVCRCAGYECAQNWECCGESCADLRTDKNNCGVCRNACRPGERCVEGNCRCGDGLGCGDGLQCCDGACVERCPCGGGFCETGELCCDESCIDPESSDTHCGECGRGCAEDRSCELGVCACKEDECDGVCVDFGSNPDHCGGCNLPCSALVGSSEHVASVRGCLGGVCQIECEAGWLDCDPTISGCETQVNNLDCGACNVACAAGSYCETGNTTPYCECSPGNKVCDDDCIPMGQCCNDAECGANRVCDQGLCVCAAGFARNCGDRCVRADQCCTDTDCNTAAEGRATCVGDQCTCVGVGVRTCPNGACIAQTACCSNELTCAGFCGTQCCLDGDCPEGRTCLWGSCVCPEGTKLCTGRCIPSTQCCIDGDCGTGAICAGGVCGCASSSEHYCGRSAGCRPSNVCCTNDDCTPGYCGGTTYLQTNGCYCTGGYIYCVNTHTCEPSQATCPSGS